MVRNAWFARGAAQKLRRSHARCRPGNLGSWRTNASSASSLSVPQARDRAAMVEAARLAQVGGFASDRACHQIQARARVESGRRTYE